MTKLIAAAVALLAVGWGAGVASSGRVNTGAALLRVAELDAQNKLTYDHAMTMQRVECEQRITALHVEAAEADAAHVVKTRDLSEAYSAHIVGLRMQLRAAGIKEIVVTP